MTTVTDIIRMFAKFGFTDTPMTVAQIEQCIRWDLTDDDIYGIGCDMASGWRFRDIIDEYYFEKGCLQ
jgi:hypothetical protein